MAEQKKLDRLNTVIKAPWRPDSLVGSFFHSTHMRGWQGCIVAEPAPGVYLVETFGWLAGESTGQHLVRLEEMGGWTFYDDAEWMNNAYRSGVAERWKRERRIAKGEDPDGDIDKVIADLDELAAGARVCDGL